MLHVDGLSSGYGEVEVLRDLTFDVDEGQVTAIIGPNGAGKSTLMRSIMGMNTVTEGSITYRGTEINDLSTHERVEQGISLVPEERYLFRGMTVSENLVLGSYVRRDDSRDERLARVLELFPRLAEREAQQAGTLSGGEAQMLTIGRGLMADPAVLLLDEPSLGLAPKLIPELFAKIEEINEDGVTIVLVEQRVNKALSIADTGYLLEDGRIAEGGPAQDLIDDETVVERYMGGEA